MRHRIASAAADGKIKALLSLFAFCSSDQWVMAALAGRACWRFFENSPMISMPFAPPVIASRWFGICENWTAREKLGRPDGVGDWDG